MKENVLDVLMYLFEHYLDDDADVDTDRDSLGQELVGAGFPESEVFKAFDWLDGLSADQVFLDEPARGGIASTRVYTREEMARLDVECRSFLLFLEQSGVLDTVARELVVDRVMALETDEFDLDQLKWVVLMVLFNQPGRESVYSWMEDFVFERSAGQLH